MQDPKDTPLEQVANYVEIVELPDPTILPKGRQPRRNQDRSKYNPHQNGRECMRRLIQILEGRLDVPQATKDALANRILEALKKPAQGTASEVSETPESQENRS